VVDAEDHETRLTYDLVGNQIQVIDAKQQATSFVFAYPSRSDSSIPSSAYWK
jgi:YD repeat-containing protein